MSLKSLLEDAWSSLERELKVCALKLIIKAEASLEGETGEEKRAYVVKQLDEAVELPWYLEPFDAGVFELIVDAVCDKLNLLCGHDWLSELEALEGDAVTELADELLASDEEGTVSVDDEATSADDDTDARITALYDKYGLTSNE